MQRLRTLSLQFLLAFCSLLAWTLHRLVLDFDWRVGHTWLSCLVGWERVHSTALRIWIVRHWVSRLLRGQPSCLYCLLYWHFGHGSYCLLALLCARTRHWFLVNRTETSSFKDRRRRDCFIQAFNVGDAHLVHSKPANCYFLCNTP